MTPLLRATRDSAGAALAGVAANLAVHYLARVPLWTDVIAEWIMARTPSRYAVAILDGLGPWAKPFAATGGLFVLGLALFVPALAASGRRRALAAGVAAAALAWIFGYRSAAGLAAFWGTAILALWPRPSASSAAQRRGALVMAAGTAVVAVESYLRERLRARNAERPRPLAAFTPPAETFAPGLVRKAVTPVSEFYGMSKNTVDPAIRAEEWRLRLTIDGREVRRLGYDDLLALPRTERYSTLRCISNTLASDLMGTAQWSGIGLGQLLGRDALPRGIREVAVIGVDGHGDSLPIEYAYTPDVMLALGMNGVTLPREHGYPLRLLAPRYYGFKNIKWIGEIALRTEPYAGTWPKMGWTKDAVIYTASHIDRVRVTPEGLLIGGVSFAGDRGIRAVEVRVDGGPWAPATLEPPLPGRTWTRWYAALAVRSARQVEARAQDGTGAWQASREKEMFPDGVAGPTRKQVNL